MKKIAAALVLLLAGGTGAYAAAPGAVHALAHACGMPCC